MNFGKYKTLSEIGKGSFGTVYKAEDKILGREVALKVLHSQLTIDHNFTDRFQQEARLAAQLDHPNLVPVYDLGQEDGRFFIVMGLMTGGSLRDRLQSNGKLSEEETKTILLQVLEGLKFIHSKNIVHRDLKPGNILFDQIGKARIADLGLAKTFLLDGHQSMSMSGGLVGTPAYMAPEIWEGKHATYAADLYSLGCIIYEMITGKVLFDGESAAEIMTKHVVRGPQLLADMQSSWEVFIQSCLSRAPEARYLKMDELPSNRADSRGFGEVRRLMQDPEVFERRTRKVNTFPSKESTLSADYRKTPVSVSKAMFNDNQVKLYRVNLSAPSNEGFWIQCLNGKCPDVHYEDIAHRYFSLVWSPDGALVAAIRSTKDVTELVLIDPVNRKERVITRGVDICLNISWSSKGNEIAYLKAGSLKAFNLITNKIRTIVGQRSIIDFNGNKYEVNSARWDTKNEYLGFWVDEPVRPAGKPPRLSKIWTVKSDGSSLMEFTPPKGYTYANFHWIEGEYAFVFSKNRIKRNLEFGGHEVMRGDIRTGKVSKMTYTYAVKSEVYFPNTLHNCRFDTAPLFDSWLPDI